MIFREKPINTPETKERCEKMSVRQAENKVTTSDTKRQGEVSTQRAKEVLERIHSAGWNAYSSKGEKTTAEEIIREGPTDRFLLKQSYVLLPIVENPKDPEEVFGRIDAMGSEPFVTIYGNRHSCTGFVFISEDQVKLNMPRGIVAPYAHFFASLSTMTDAYRLTQSRRTS